MIQLFFSVPGRPATAGSKVAIPIRARDGKQRVILVDSSKQHGRVWRLAVQEVAARARTEKGLTELLSAPLSLSVVFVFPRPKAHYGAKGLKPSAPDWPAVKPDVTKLMRAIEDALTGVIWRDDAQVVITNATKIYGPSWETRVVIMSPPA